MTNTLFVTAPERFDLAKKEDRTAVLRCITRLREAALQRGRQIVLDFSGSRRMYADGTLLLRAELCRLTHHAAPGVRIRCRPPRNPKVSQVLTQVGIYDLLHYRHRLAPRDTDVVHWRVAQGADADGEKYDEILGHYEGNVPEALLSGLFVGITEAMTNTKHHAYLGPRQDGLELAAEPGGWWMFSQHRDGVLHVTFCDLGIGIPGSLPRRHPGIIERLRTALGREPPDGDTILEAVNESRTRTGQAHRGKGLRQLLDAVESAEGGRLVIFSNRGYYSIGPHGEHASDYKDSILGTMICWSLPVANLTDAHG